MDIHGYQEGELKHSSRLRSGLGLAEHAVAGRPSVPYTESVQVRKLVVSINPQDNLGAPHQSSHSAQDIANLRKREQLTYLVIFQLRLLLFASRCHGQQPGPTLALQFHDDTVKIRTFRAFQDDSPTDLVEVGKANVSCLVENDRGVHGCAWDPLS